MTPVTSVTVSLLVFSENRGIRGPLPPFLFSGGGYARVSQAVSGPQVGFGSELSAQGRTDSSVQCAPGPDAWWNSALMPCYSPLEAWKMPGGAPPVFGPPRAGRKDIGRLMLPCGQCIGCRLDRSVDWAVRIMCEAQLHEFSSFVTLTYDDAHLPYGGTLYYPHVQSFLKRYRKNVGKVRFFLCGEYGETLGRPHYHACMFGSRFSDRYPWRKSAAGFQLYRSALLDSLWDFGGAEIGDLSFDSAAYVARYCVKKVTGEAACLHYAKLIPDTGEVIQVMPEFARMSLKPGIGLPWLSKYKADILPRDAVVVQGRERPIPKYFLDHLSEDDLSGFQVRRYAEYLKKGASSEQSAKRLRVRETVARARMSIYQRNKVE